MDKYGAVLGRGFADPVLCWCLACRANLGVAETIKQRAQQALQANVEDYGIVLRDLLPEKARVSVEDVLYNANRNRTAARDWAAFLRQIEVQRGQPAQGLLTGFPALDQATGGLGGVALLAGLTASG